MLPSDLVFSPVISESETLGFFWKSNQLLLCIFKHSVRRGSLPCPLTPNSGHWGVIPYKRSLGSTQQKESLFILARALKRCDNVSSTLRPEHSSPRFPVLILVLWMNSPGGSRNFPQEGGMGHRGSGKQPRGLEEPGSPCNSGWRRCPAAASISRAAHS